MFSSEIAFHFYFHIPPLSLHLSEKTEQVKVRYDDILCEKIKLVLIFTSAPGVPKMSINTCEQKLGLICLQRSLVSRRSLYFVPSVTGE